MKLSDHAEHIRQLIDTAFRNRLGRMGITPTSIQTIEIIPAEYREDRKRIDTVREVFISETGTADAAYEKLVEELSFTLFNRLAALKVMEAHGLHAEIITRRSQHGNRSFAHLHFLEQNPDKRSEEQEGLVSFIKDQLNSLSNEIPLFSLNHPYHLLPTAIELNGIISAFNQIETDQQVEPEIWKSDDVLGWLYESYNNSKKTAFKESGDKVEYNKVSIQSQIYTPRWVVKFLVDNSLGKLYLEMYPESTIKEKYKIANAPMKQLRKPKPITEIRLIDPATGSGNFLLYGFDLFYDIYMDQIDNYGADYDQAKIPELIIRHNLHGIDLDDRAIQLAQLGLYIKAKRKKRSSKIEHFNVVSSDFFLPEYEEIKELFEGEGKLDSDLKKIVTDIWADLQKAYKFGSLLRIEEKFNIKLHEWKDKKLNSLPLFEAATIANYAEFRKNFFSNLQKAVALNTKKQGLTFLNTKTSDAITFLQLLTRKYDIAVANPPYTDSADFGVELKGFIDSNYRKPHKFNTNLYATFIKRCCELTDEKGKVALIHPLTFMYISTFEDVRKFILEEMQIDIFIEFGLGGIFTSKVDVDVAGYILEKEKKEKKLSFFMNLQHYKGLKIKKTIFETAMLDNFNNIVNKHNYKLDQSKLKIIDGWPFIYWISDAFREKFKEKSLDNELFIVTGLMTGNNDKYLRYKWEVDKYSTDYRKDSIKWVPYQKGGDFNRWYGNNWLVVNYESNGKLLATTDNKRFYFREGITYSATSSKGVSFRKIESNQIFDKKGSCLFLKCLSDTFHINYFLALLNTKFVSYVSNCLNSTVETQVGDIKRVPFIQPTKELENTISVLSFQNIEIKKILCTYHIIESNFDKTPLSSFSESTLQNRLVSYFNYENSQLVQMFIDDAIINKLILDLYELSTEDRLQVEAKMGKPVGSLPVFAEARKVYLDSVSLENYEVKKFINNLDTVIFDETKIRELKDGFSKLYQSNNDLEEFCLRNQVNPINVWYLFKKARILPQGRAHEIALEFLADTIRSILMEDEDGIIPLVGLPEEPRLLDRLEKYCLEKGFTSAQFMQLDSLLGRPIDEYLEHHFFKNLSDHLNLFRHLPKTPFIWHLSSGEHQGFEAYIVIYKWNRDSLYKLKTQYLAKRVENLEYRQLNLADSNTAAAQNEKETIRLQLREISEFTKKIDELIAEGYDPKLDDGVGKNIAPLQAKGLIPYEVLSKNQLKKYLNADW